MESLAATEAVGRLPLGEQFAVFDEVTDEAYDIINNLFVTTEDGEVFPWAADDENYRYAVFTSDACKILLDLYEARSDPRAMEILITKGPAILKTICSEQWLSSQQPKLWKDPLHYRQRKKNAQLANAEVGQFPHEQRKRVFAPGIVADDSAVERLERLARARGGSKDKLVDYGRIDSVGLVINTYGRLRSISDPRMQTALDEPFRHSTGVMRTLEQAMLDSGQWALRRIARSGINMIERLRAFPGDKRHKNWKDSLTSHMHIDGSLANTEREVADIEVQTEYVEALNEYAGLLAAAGRHDEANEVRWVQHNLKYAIAKTFWVDGDPTLPGLQQESRLVTGVDRDEQGSVRPIRIPGGTSASCLRYYPFSGDMDDYPLAAAAVRAVNSPDLRTPIGVRSRSILYQHLLSFVDIQGSFPVWLTENSNIGVALYHLMAYQTLANLAVGALAGAVVGGLREYNLCSAKGNLLLPHDPNDRHAAPFIGNAETIELAAEAHAQRRQGFAASGAIVLHSLLKRIAIDLAFDYAQGWTGAPWWIKADEDAQLTQDVLPIYFRPGDAIEAVRRSVVLYRKQQVPMNDAFEPIIA
jgi:hypothetical protein